MRIRWTPSAASDLERISDYLRDRYPRYREQTIRKLFDSIRALKKWPIYRVREEIVEVLRIYHGARNRP